jgi:hypothetical protein
MDYSNQQNFPQQNNQGFNKTIIFVVSAAAIIVIAVLVFVLITMDNKNDAGDEEKQTSKRKEKSAVQETTPPPPVTKSNQEVEIEVKSATIRFLKFWSDKDLSGLSGMMTEDYQYETATGVNKYQDKSERLEVWSQQFVQRRFISVTGENLNVSVSSPNTARVAYDQTYISDQYNDSGLKVLYFRYESGMWKIYKDSFY